MERIGLSLAHVKACSSAGDPRSGTDPIGARSGGYRGLVGIIEEQVEQLRQQEELIGQLKDEIAVLKGEKRRPRFKASEFKCKFS
jgi:hypothetical protein